MLKTLPMNLGHYLPGVFASRDSSRSYDDVSLRSAAYVIQGDGHCGIVDTGVGVHAFRALARHLASQRAVPEWIVLTHDHYDHIGNASALQDRYGVSVLVHGRDRPLVEQPLRIFDERWMEGAHGGTLQDAFREMNRSHDEYLAHQREVARDQYYPVTVDGLVQDGDVLELGDMQLQIIHTPGHSPGSVSVYLPAQGAVLAGDLPLWLGPARPHPLGSYAQWRRSTERLLSLDVRMLAWGHGTPTSGRERCRRLLRSTVQRVRHMEERLLTVLRRRERTICSLRDEFSDGGDPFRHRLLEDSLHAMLHSMSDEGAVSTMQRDGYVYWCAH